MSRTEKQPAAPISACTKTRTAETLLSLGLPGLVDDSAGLFRVLFRNLKSDTAAASSEIPGRILRSELIRYERWNVSRLKRDLKPLRLLNVETLCDRDHS